MSVYAVIHTGGKQYRVSPGDVVQVEKLAAQPGEKIELDRVYLLAHDGRISTGTPVLKSTRVVAQVLGQDRGEKIIIFKHRRRKGYRNTTGHRQSFTELKIIEIIHEGASYRKEEKPQQSQKPAAAATPPPVKKSDAAKQRAATKKKPEKQAAEPAPRQPEKPKIAEQRVAPESAPIPPASAPGETPKAEPFVPAAPSQEPEKPLPPARPVEEAKPLPIGQEEKPSADKRVPWWIIGAIIAALALLGLLLFLGSDRPSPGPGTRQETGGKPTPEKKIKPKPPVRDVKMKETAPVDKPATPAQPPD